MQADLNSPEVALVPVTARHANVTRDSWWNADGSMDFGAGPLVYRCMREYYWSKEYTLRVLKGYRQFLELKKILEDWDAKILAPSPPVNQMWLQHILDVANYCHDCLLICGRVIGNDPDCALDEWALEKRMLATKQLLRARFEREIDSDIWRFDDSASSVVPDVRGSAGMSAVGNVGSASRPTATMCMSGLTAEEKKYEQFIEEKKKFQASLLAHGTPFDYDVRRFRPSSTAITLDEKRDDEETASGKSRTTTKDSVVIHHDEDKEIEVVEQPTFRVRVRTLKGSIYSLDVNKHMTVLEVKSMIQKEYGVPEDKQHLLFYGKVLEDRKTLEECAIPPESGLQLLVRSRKPMDVSIF
jgi:Ubiquitin family